MIPMSSSNGGFGQVSKNKNPGTIAFLSSARSELPRFGSFSAFQGKKHLSTLVYMLQQFENQIEAAEGNPWQIAENLQVIHDEKLYEPKYRSFAAYCRKRWRYSRQSAYNYISAMQVVKTCGIRTSRDLKITRLRPLFNLDSPRQQKAWGCGNKDCGKFDTDRRPDQSRYYIYDGK